MITAKITAVGSSRNGGIPFAFAKAPDLQSDDNPNEFVTFTIVPEVWRGRDLPRIGETVALGQLKKKVKPESPAPSNYLPLRRKLEQFKPALVLPKTHVFARLVRTTRQ